MSYDLLVFAADRAPRNREAFLEWWFQTAEWSENHSYDDPQISTPELRAWFMEMIQTFPALNGPFSSQNLPEDEASATEYCFGITAIYACFAWSKAEPAYEHTFRLAGKHQLGFFDASSEKSAVWLPDGNGGLKLAHEGEEREE
jgi:hypothetical protein